MASEDLHTQSPHSRIAAGARRAAAAVLTAWTLAGPPAGVEEPALPPLPAAGPADDQPIAGVLFVAFDTETTGFSPEKDRVVEIGAVKFSSGAVVATRSWLIHPGRSIPFWAERVHGITDEMVARKPSFGEVYPEFQAFIGDAVLLAHNARFDIGFIREEALRHGLFPPANEVLDSLTLFRTWFPEAPSHSLEGLVEHLHVESGDFHRAVADAATIRHLLALGLEQHTEVRLFKALRADAGGGLRF